MRWMNIQEEFKNRGNEDNTYIYVSGISHGVYSCFQVKQIKSDPLICTHSRVFQGCVMGPCVLLGPPDPI